MLSEPVPPDLEREVPSVQHAFDMALNPLAADDAPDKEYIRCQTFSGQLDQVREARAFATEFVQGSPVADDLVLCVSEFSANAVLHSHSREQDGKFAVRIEVHEPDYTWVEVEDDGGPWEQHPDGGLPGHGLDIVGKIASDWGIDGGLSGWIAWARLDWPRS